MRVTFVPGGGGMAGTSFHAGLPAGGIERWAVSDETPRSVSGGIVGVSEEHVDRWLGERPAGATILVGKLSELAQGGGATGCSRSGSLIRASRTRRS